MLKGDYEWRWKWVYEYDVFSHKYEYRYKYVYEYVIKTDDAYNISSNNSINKPLAIKTEDNQKEEKINNSNDVKAEANHKEEKISNSSSIKAEINHNNCNVGSSEGGGGYYTFPTEGGKINYNHKEEEINKSESYRAVIKKSSIILLIMNILYIIFVVIFSISKSADVINYVFSLPIYGICEVIYIIFTFKLLFSDNLESLSCYLIIVLGFSLLSFTILLRDTNDNDYSSYGCTLLWGSGFLLIFSLIYCIVIWKIKLKIN